MGHNKRFNIENFDIYIESQNIDCYVSMAEMLRPKKKVKKKNLSTITLGYLQTKKGSLKVKHQKRIKILFDTGCGATLIHHSLVKRLKSKEEQPSNWSTKAGSFQTTKTCKIKFTLPAFHEKRDISWKAFC